MSAEATCETWRWGSEPDRHAVWYWPQTRQETRVPTVVLLHGGFWKASYDLALMAPLAADLARLGAAACVLEYRRRAPDEVGIADATLADVLDGWRACAAHPRVDRERLAVVGHSAGGTLALLVAARGGPAPRLAVAQAAVADLRAADAARLSDEGTAVRDWIGTSPDADLARWERFDPVAHPPVCQVVLVHGMGDCDVPPSQSTGYHHAHAATGLVTYVPVVGDHYAVIDPSSDAWRTPRTLMLQALGLAP